jgi:hypothetical protein
MNQFLINVPNTNSKHFLSFLEKFILSNKPIELK